MSKLIEETPRQKHSLFLNSVCSIELKVDEIVQHFFQGDSKMDRVELAFRKFDLNKDGFLSREEFDLVS